MKNNRIVGIVVLVKGILMVLIGVIHTIAIYFEFQEAIKNMSEYWAISHAVWFGITGIFFIYIGIIDLLSFMGIKRGSKHAWITSLISGIFSLVIGSIGTYIFRNDEMIPIFPMIICLLGLISFIVLMVNKGKYYGNNIICL